MILASRTEEPPEFQINKGRRDPDFPYRKFVGCSKCGKPLYGSASKGSNGTRYPAYHCDKAHYFLIPKDKLEANVLTFIKHIVVTPESAQLIQDKVMNDWNRRQEALNSDMVLIDQQIKGLALEAEITLRKIKYLESETAIKFIGEDIVRIDKQAKTLQAEKDQKEGSTKVNFGVVLGRVRYYLAHLDQLLQKQIDPLKKLSFSGQSLTKYRDIQI